MSLWNDYHYCHTQVLVKHARVTRFSGGVEEGKNKNEK
jgi:hypothetical protein